MFLRGAAEEDCKWPDYPREENYILFDYVQNSVPLAIMGVIVRVMDDFSQTSSLTLADCLSENIHNTLSWRNSSHCYIGVAELHR